MELLKRIPFQVILAMGFGLLSHQSLADWYNPLSAVVNAVEAVAEDRSTSDIAVDAEILVKLTAEIADKLGAKAALTVSKDVYEQRVLITGVTATAKDKAKVEAIVRATAKVKKVINELQMPSPATDKTSDAAEEFVDDVVVEKKIYAKMAADDVIHHTNWRYRSVGGVVYLFGRALSQAEFDKANALAKDTKNVKKLINHAVIRK